MTDEFFKFVLAQSILVGWILFVVIFYDRLLGFLIEHLILKRYLVMSSHVSLSIGSASFKILTRSPKCILRDLKLKSAKKNSITSSWSLGIDQLEISLNQCMRKSTTLDRKLFHIKSINTTLFYDTNFANDDFDSDLLSSFIKRAILDIDHLSALFYNSKTLQSYHLDLSRLGLIWTQVTDTNNNNAVTELDSIAFNPQDLRAQIVAKSSQINFSYCHDFLAKKKPMRSRQVLAIDEIKLKLSLFKHPRQFQVNEHHTCQSIPLIEFKSNRIRVNIDLIDGRLINLIRNRLVYSAVCKFHLTCLELVLPLVDDYFIFSSKSNVYGRVCPHFVTIKLVRVEINSFLNKIPMLNCDGSIEINIQFSSLFLVGVEVKDRFSLCIEQFISIFRIVKLSVCCSRDFELKIYGGPVDLADGLFGLGIINEIDFRMNYQSIDRSMRGLVLLDRIIVADSTRTIEFSTERVHGEFTSSTIDFMWQVITSPIRIGRYQPRLNSSSVCCANGKSKKMTSSLSNMSSLDSYLYTYTANLDEDDDESEFDQSSSLEEENENDIPLDSDLIDMNCWYVSVIQFRSESLKNHSRTYSNRYELILGDVFGTVELEHFRVAFESFTHTTTTLLSNKLFSNLTDLDHSLHLNIRMLTSLTHVNLVHNAALFNLVVSPLDYAQCNSHEMAILPDVHLTFLASVPTTTRTGVKYADLIECGSIGIRCTVFKRRREALTESKLERLRIVDRETRRLTFLWTTSPNQEQKCECGQISSENSQFFQSSKLYDFDNEFYTKPCVYSSTTRNGKFGQSLLVTNEPTFYSHRTFMCSIGEEIPTRFHRRPKQRITETLHVLACLEHNAASSSTTTTDTKSYFQPFEIYVYENDVLNLFLNELYVHSGGRNVTEKPNALEIPHMTPPYFSPDFQLYIRFLPIIRNLTRPTWCSPHQITIKWPQLTTSQLPISDLVHDIKPASNRRSKSNSRRKESSELASKDQRTPSLRNEQRYKFSISQLNAPVNERKMSWRGRHQAAMDMLDGKRLRVEEAFVECVRLIESTTRSQQEERDLSSITVDYPSDDSTPVVLFLAMLNVRCLVDAYNLIDFVKPSENKVENRFYHSTVNNESSRAQKSSILGCVGQLFISNNGETTPMIEAKNISAYYSTESFTLHKTIIIGELILSLSSNDSTFHSILANLFKLENDFQINLTVHKTCLKCPNDYQFVLLARSQVDLMFDRRERYFELRSKIESAVKYELTMSNLNRLLSFVFRLASSFSHILADQTTAYNIEASLNKFEVRIDSDQTYSTCLMVDAIRFHASNRFESISDTSSCRFKLATSGRVDWIKHGGENNRIGRVEFRLEKNVLDAELRVRVRFGHQKLFVKVELPMFAEFKLNLTECRVGRAFVVVANCESNSESNYALVLDLIGMRISRSISDQKNDDSLLLSIECDLLRAVQCAQIYDLLDFDLGVLNNRTGEFRSRFVAKQMIWSVFPSESFNQHETSKNYSDETKNYWLYLNLFAFQVDYYSTKDESGLTEEFCVRIAAAPDAVRNDSPQKPIRIETDQLAPQESVCLWISSSESSKLKTARSILNYSSMQQIDEQAYTIRPVVKLPDLELTFTFGSNSISSNKLSQQTTRIDWCYNLAPVTNIADLFVDSDSLEHVWNLLIRDVMFEYDKHGKLYQLSLAMSSTNRNRFRIKRWTVSSQEDVINDGQLLAFIDPNLLGVVLKERIVLFSVLSSLSLI